jgi:hypothetical protein
MHAVDQGEFLREIALFLGMFYVTLSVMNGVRAFLLWNSHQEKKLFRLPILDIDVTESLIWTVVSIFFASIAPIAMSGSEEWAALISIPKPIRAALDVIMGPVVYTIGTFVLLAILYVTREVWVKPAIAWTLLNLSCLAMGLAMTDHNFALIVTKPDNVPIVGMVFLLGFFTWLATKKAVDNDRRTARGLEPLEKLDDEKVLVWPDLVYTELICMIALTALLIIWGILLKAPLEEPASAVKTPNPSKAPWYFLGLQEMLVYYDPWMAGVVLPSVVVFGLMAIPFIDFNKKGNGYYTIAERQFAYIMFQFGFLSLWVTLIVMGTFLRGPNWNFFGFFELWDPHKVEALNNRDLSEMFWIDWLGVERPKAADNASELAKLGKILFRESPGIVLVIAYMTMVPPALIVASKFFRDMFLKMGLIRYMVMTNLLLLMMSLPIKMICRWTVNLKYFVGMPEYLLNL